MSSNSRPKVAERQALAELLLDRFPGRNDAVVVDRGDGLRREDLDEPLAARDIARDHLGGKVCYAQYILRPDGKVCCSALDFDNKADRPDPDWRKKTRRVARRLRELGFEPIVELSQSGSAAHVWIIFAIAVFAWRVRAFWRAVLADLAIPEPEIFPRQDSLPEGKFGNAIRIPLFNRSRFVDPFKGWQTLDPLDALKRAKRYVAADLKEAAAELGVELKKPAKKNLSLSGDGATSVPLPAHVAELVADEHTKLGKRWRGDVTGLGDKSRSSAAFSIVCSLIRRYVDTEDITTALRHWCAIQGYEKGDREDWIETTVQKAYEFVQNADRADRAARFSQGRTINGRRRALRRKPIH